MTQRRPIKNDTIMFVTTNTFYRKRFFDNPAYAREAASHLYNVQLLHPFLLFGFVIMPDHCHFLMNVPAPETISKIMNVYKSGLTFQLGVPKIWQPRYDMRIPNNSVKVLQYIHQNPVRAGLVENSADYPWSSASGKWDATPLECWPDRR